MAEIREPLARLPNSELQALRRASRDADRLRAENERLREALCNCGGPEQGAEPSGHADWCRLTELDRHDSSQSASSDNERGAE